MGPSTEASLSSSSIADFLSPTDPHTISTDLPPSAAAFHSRSGTSIPTLTNVAATGIQSTIHVVNQFKADYVCRVLNLFGPTNTLRSLEQSIKLVKPARITAIVIFSKRIGQYVVVRRTP